MMRIRKLVDVPPRVLDSYGVGRVGRMQRDGDAVGAAAIGDGGATRTPSLAG